MNQLGIKSHPPRDSSRVQGKGRQGKQRMGRQYNRVDPGSCPRLQEMEDTGGLMFINAVILKYVLIIYKIYEILSDFQ
jgi:hypothetical protein